MWRLSRPPHGGRTGAGTGGEADQITLDADRRRYERFVSVCIGRGAAAGVIEACILDLVEPVISRALYLEYEDVLNRSGLFDHARLDAIERDTLLDIFLGKCELIDIYYRWRPNLRDEGDNHLIELAVAGGADIVVTNNLRDFRDPELKFDRPQIMTPQDTLSELNK